MKLPRSSALYGTADFTRGFVDEVSALPPDSLPLQQAMAQGNMVTDDALQVMVNSVDCDDRQLRVKAGIFFTSMIAGCSCADDPSPVDKINEYAELEFYICLDDASTQVRIAS
jgi:hypothetical protein